MANIEEVKSYFEQYVKDHPNLFFECADISLFEQIRSKIEFWLLACGEVPPEKIEEIRKMILSAFEGHKIAAAK